MYIAYSALQNLQQQPDHIIGPYNEQALRYLAYLETCNKYSREIAEIQKYLPGWQPALPAYQ
jgi:hypothetical protein